MIRVSPDEIKRLFESDGTRFPCLMDDILESACVYCGFSTTSCSTRHKTNLPDDGVDATVFEPLDGFHPIFFGQKTILQYKAQTKKPTRSDFEEDFLTRRNGENPRIGKPHLLRRLEDGFAVRWCYLGMPQDRDVAGIETDLNAVLDSIYPDHEPGKLVRVQDISKFLNYFPGIVLRHFHAPLIGEGIFSVDTSLRSLREKVPEYFTPANRLSTRDLLFEHLSFSYRPTSLVFKLSAPPGTGKTRFICEETLRCQGHSMGAIYCSDSASGIKFLNALAQQEFDGNAIIIVDDCPREDASQLTRLADLIGNSIRVVIIQHPSEMPLVIDPFYNLAVIGEEDIRDNILNQLDGPRIDDASRENAAIHCNHCVSLAIKFAEENTTDIPSLIERYLRAEEQEILRVFSFFIKIGHLGDLSNQMKCIMRALKIDNLDFARILNRLKDSGFIQLSGRYYHIPMEPVQEYLLLEEWNAQFRTQETAFLDFIKTFPQELIDSMNQAFVKYADDQVRSEYACFFRAWVKGIEPADLSILDVTDWICSLIRLDPETYMPILRQLVERATDVELGLSTRLVSGRWAPRRYLVWLLVEALSFEAYFYDAEYCLRRFMLTESESDIGNNSTQMWIKLFDPRWEVTQVPFDVRLALWHTYTEEKGEELVKHAIDAAFEAYKSGIGPAKLETALGRPFPNVWRAQTMQEITDYVSRMIARVVDIAANQEHTGQAYARNKLIDNIRSVVEFVSVEQLKQVLTRDCDDEKAKLLIKLEEVVQYDADSLGSDAINAIESWRDEIAGAGFEGRIRKLFNVPIWLQYKNRDEEANQRELTQIANMLVDDADLLEKWLEYLSDSSLKGPIIDLGRALGQLDVEISLLDKLRNVIGPDNNSMLFRGYLLSILNHPGGKEHAVLATESISEINPGAAFILLMLLNRHFSCYDILVKWLKAGKVPIKWLSSQPFGLGDPIDVDGLCNIIRYLDAERADDTAAAGAIIALVGNCIKDNKNFNLLEFPCLDELLTALFLYTKVTSEEQKLGTFNLPDYEWGMIVERFADSEDPDAPSGAAKLYVNALTSDKYNLAQDVEKRLLKLLPAQTLVVANEIVSLCLEDDFRYFNFTFHEARDLLDAFDAGIFIEWLKSQPEKNILMFARNLPRAKKGDDGLITLPLITRLAVEAFGENTNIMEEMICGQTSYGVMRIYQGVFDEFASRYDPFHSDENRHVRKWAMTVSASFRAQEESYRLEREERKLER